MKLTILLQYPTRTLLALTAMAEAHEKGAEAVTYRGLQQKYLPGKTENAVKLGVLDLARHSPPLAEKVTHAKDGRPLRTMGHGVKALYRLTEEGLRISRT